MELCDAAYAEALGAGEYLFEARRLDAVHAIGAPRGEQRGEQGGAMAGVERPDERAVVVEPALEGVACLTVLSSGALLVELLEEVTDEGERDGHAIQVCHGEPSRCERTREEFSAKRLEDIVEGCRLNA